MSLVGKGFAVLITGYDSKGMVRPRSRSAAGRGSQLQHFLIRTMLVYENASSALAKRRHRMIGLAAPEKPIQQATMPRFLAALDRGRHHRWRATP